MSHILQNIDANELSTKGFNIYPNPASDHIIISFEANDSKERVLTIFDLSGKIVLQEDLASLIQGDENIHAVQKLFINR